MHVICLCGKEIMFIVEDVTLCNTVVPGPDCSLPSTREQDVLCSVPAELCHPEIVEADT